MECHCISGKLDLILKPLGCDLVVIDDISDWMRDTYYKIPESFTVYVTTPGKKVSHPIQVFTNKANKFSPIDFGQSGKYFLDGIYCFSLESCGVKYSINRAITCTIDCCLDDLIGKVKPEEDINDVTRIKFLRDSIHINAELGKLNKAIDLYDIVQKFLRRLNCNCK